MRQGHGLWWKAGGYLSWRPLLPTQGVGILAHTPEEVWRSGSDIGKVVVEFEGAWEGPRSVSGATMMTEGEQDVGGYVEGGECRTG